MQFVLRAMTRANQEEWDAESLRQLYDEVDEPTKSLIAIVAQATAKAKDLTEGDVADKLQFSRRETVGIMRELIDSCREMNRQPVIAPRVTSEVLPNGRTREIRIMVMPEEIAAEMMVIVKDDLSGTEPNAGTSQ